MRNIVIAAAAVIAGITCVSAQQKPAVDTAKVDAAIVAAFPNPPAEFKSRFEQGETLKACSINENSPPKPVADAIQQREKARIEYPVDGKLAGDWTVGEKLAQSGYGLRFSDYPPRNVNGGNCYACHALSPREVAAGNLGPSLTGYAKLRGTSDASVRYTYEKIFNAQAYLACSFMPRFGHNGWLTPEQVADITAFLLDPQSPVNR